MKFRISLPRFGIYLALLLMVYQNVTAMTQHYGLNTILISASMLMVTAISLFSVFRKPVLTGSIEMVMLLYCLYAMFVCLVNGYLAVFVQTPSLPFSIFFWIFVFLLFYESSKNKILDIQKLSLFFFVMTIISSILFYGYFKSSVESDAESTILMNNAYYIVFMLPAVLISKNKKIIIPTIVINVFVILLSGKRGALLALIISLFYWMFSGTEKRNIWKILQRIFLYLLLSAFIVVMAEKIIREYNLIIFDRVNAFISGEDYEGSGRLGIWSSYFNFILSDYWINNILGRGYFATTINPLFIKLNISWAHNDFLQIFFDYGLLGLILFGSIVFKLVIKIFEMKKYGYKYCKQYTISLIIFIICCFVSMVTVMPYWFLSMAAFWGATIGDFENEISEVKS